MLELNGVPVDDTYCEAFDGIYSRIIVTAKHKWLLKKAAYSATALPSTVFGEAEGGVEKWLSPQETPDGRLGAICQIWVQKSKKFLDVLMREMGKRIRQGILVVPTTRVFNATESETKFDAEINVGRCGDGYEWEDEMWGRKVIRVPIMFGEFIIERYIGYAEGIAGGNIWYFCESEEAALEAGEAAVEALKQLDGVITSFDICSAGSKPETKYPEMGPSTNHYFCPTLKGKIPDSKVPDGVKSIPEIVINGIKREVVEKAMFVCMDVVSKIDGVVRISAGNYEGKLGQHKIYLKDLIEKYS
ncbi:MULTISPECIES: formylmethanofuran--tetrahydromethanopterin N-formyltransferase [Archaeoglobus]|uniref:Formylmethanofuran--tetrahydromethanopterin formyltransferase-like protein n=3 Tax=Archaeoglobus fulgidus TaxID=2234 RepID=FTRL_ARCFU|nr:MULTISPECIES: formylmethanofuran--tetrahydromethanopterin N-formyltransferase [Archaeoglobus]O28206.1 RecName: Full=Formylmethanofuran--tetrahydromethanopterin formyltransferase-like protein [Archaeoglobus fulgidus DSM 4304]AAB89176.1 formylmethanofuran:tetrahydromethanopterin formyltransferase (ftr-1) [Archaeoglobus fulgidus DSM 4304]AIG99062.1 Formylmethanofuran:tetrahydromethanopterin formyltransferase [Archaeoglobus fulgidus DSM 8774]KUJ93369.1 MAG: Formylmethanofuran--tetrahydromethanop